MFLLDPFLAVTHSHFAFALLTNRVITDESSGEEEGKDEEYEEEEEEEEGEEQEQEQEQEGTNKSYCCCICQKHLPHCDVISHWLMSDIHTERTIRGSLFIRPVDVFFLKNGRKTI